MFKRILIASIFLIPLGCSAQEKAASPQVPMPLDEQEKTDHLRNALSSIEKMQMAVDEMSRIKTAQCMKAIGIPRFCSCIVNKSPVAIDFPQYVSILSQTKEDLKYDQMSLGDKQLIDNARSARDACVSWYGKAATTPEQIAPSNGAKSLP